MAIGVIDHASLMRAIELFGTEGGAGGAQGDRRRLTAYQAIRKPKVARPAVLSPKFDRLVATWPSP